MYEPPPQQSMQQPQPYGQQPYGQQPYAQQPYGQQPQQQQQLSPQRSLSDPAVIDTTDLRAFLMRCAASPPRCTAVVAAQRHGRPRHHGTAMSTHTHTRSWLGLYGVLPTALNRSSRAPWQTGAAGRDGAVLHPAEEERPRPPLPHVRDLPQGRRPVPARRAQAQEEQVVQLSHLARQGGPRAAERQLLRQAALQLHRHRVRALRQGDQPREARRRAEGQLAHPGAAGAGHRALQAERPRLAGAAQDEGDGAAHRRRGAAQGAQAHLDAGEHARAVQGAQGRPRRDDPQEQAPQVERPGGRLRSQLQRPCDEGLCQELSAV